MYSQRNPRAHGWTRRSLALSVLLIWACGAGEISQGEGSAVASRDSSGVFLVENAEPAWGTGEGS